MIKVQRYRTPWDLSWTIRHHADMMEREMEREERAIEERGRHLRGHDYLSPILAFHARTRAEDARLQIRRHRHAIARLAEKGEVNP